MTNQTNQTNAGWYADRSDPMITRYWNGKKWTDERRWDGIEWITAPGEPEPLPSDATVANVGATPAGWPTSFKVFVGAACAAAIGCIAPIVTVTNDSGYSEARNLASAGGGAAVIIVVPAAVALWLAWPACIGAISTRRLWGIGAMGAILGALTLVLFAQMGTTTHESDLVFTTVTQTQTAEPGLGLYLLLTATVLQAVGIYLTIRGRTIVNAPGHPAVAAANSVQLPPPSSNSAV